MSYSRRRSNYSFFSASERPRFFKVILEETLETGMLEIPKEFVRKYGSLSDSVLLGLPNGAVWQVEVYENDDGVWLDDGWKEFVDFYSLGYGFLIVFEHKGGSEFQLIIFDNSTMEIKYPNSSIVFNEKPERSVDEDSIEIVDDFDTSQRSRERAPLKSPNPQYSEPKLGTPRCCKKIGVLLFTSYHKKKKEKNEQKNDDYWSTDFKALLHYAKTKKDGGATSTHGRTNLKAGLVDKKSRLTSQEKYEACQRAKDFHSENPYFMVVIQRRCVHPKYELGIPIDFAKRHLGDKYSDVILRVSDDRIWPAAYRYYSKLVKPKATICHGWKSFVDDHNIKVGDLCVFELIKISPIWLEVFIFRGD